MIVGSPSLSLSSERYGGGREEPRPQGFRFFGRRREQGLVACRQERGTGDVNQSSHRSQHAEEKHRRRIGGVPCGVRCGFPGPAGDLEAGFAVRPSPAAEIFRWRRCEERRESTYVINICFCTSSLRSRLCSNTSTYVGTYVQFVVGIIQCIIYTYVVVGICVVLDARTSYPIGRAALLHLLYLKKLEY